MQDIREISRRPAPFPKPQSVAFDGTSLWIGSVATSKIYRLDPETLAISFEADAPGKPWGMTYARGELRVLCGETDDDNRFVHRFVPGTGFVAGESFQCPDDTGSQLGFDGERLFISQWYNRRILQADETGVHEVIDVHHQIVGQVIVDGRFYLITTEDEETDDYWVTRVDGRNGQRRATDLARVPFPARALSFDGTRFWTNHREADQIVSFTLA